MHNYARIIFHNILTPPQLQFNAAKSCFTTCCMFLLKPDKITIEVFNFLTFCITFAKSMWRKSSRAAQKRWKKPTAPTAARPLPTGFKCCLNQPIVELSNSLCLINYSV